MNCLNICDHNTIEGALELEKIAPFKVIVSEEIETPEGEIMGMFLHKAVPRGLSPETTIQLIREQQGLVCIPHPFEKMRSSSMQASTLNRIKHLVDIIEVYNAKTWPFENKAQTLTFARNNNLPVIAGSDAHSLRDIGSYYIEMPDFADIASFLASLQSASIGGKANSLARHCSTLLARFFCKIKSRIGLN